MPTNSTSAESADEFVISRVFDAPRDLVWKLWTEDEHLASPTAKVRAGK